MDIRSFLADLLCILIPLFSLDAWQLRRVKSVDPVHSKGATWILTSSIVVSSVAASIFNFQLAKGVSVNLSIVALTLGFYLLTWVYGLLILFFYVLFEAAISIGMASAGHLTIHTVLSVLVQLPRALEILAVYAVIMTACTILTRRWSWVRRSVVFIIGVFLYSMFDYAYVSYTTHLHGLRLPVFLTFVFVINAAFLVAVRIVIAGRNAEARRVNEGRVDKLQMISQLAASVAHEVRNPITVVRGYTQLMLQETYSRDKMAQFLDLMLTELDRAERVIADYLQLARPHGTEEVTVVNLSELVAHAIDVLTPYAASFSTELSRSLDEQLFVRGVDFTVMQAVVNLLKNAIEANEEPGVVHITLKRDGVTAQLVVHDHGRGIAKAELEKLGQPYYSTKAQGTGLGLTFAYKVFHEMHGTVEVESKEGAGTRFTIALPIVARTKKE